MAMRMRDEDTPYLFDDHVAEYALPDELSEHQLRRLEGLVAVLPWHTERIEELKYHGLRHGYLLTNSASNGLTRHTLAVAHTNAFRPEDFYMLTKEKIGLLPQHMSTHPFLRQGYSTFSSLI